ncbi:hypothetical protein TcBrA4_0136030 [Trypanosoma cruzi]|nr:hypothetical protein TcBrA4_0136030 [Trypanosoma cruzi]
MSSIPDGLFGSWLLTMFNGLDLRNEVRRFKMRFSRAQNDVEVRALVVNVMSGFMEYRDGKLTGGMASTLSLAPPFFMGIENFLRNGFAAGMDVRLEGDVLTLVHGEDVLVLTAE